jgi:chlorophyllide a oxygenase
VAASEQRLADTIASLGGLEAAAAGFAACGVAPRPGAAAAAADLAEAPARALERTRGGPEARRRGLHSSLDPPARLREFWFPAAFSAKLARGAAVPFELLGEPWVLFRDADGAPACVRDECTHRACPLSLARARHAGPTSPCHLAARYVSRSCSSLQRTSGGHGSMFCGQQGVFPKVQMPGT